MFPRYGCSKDFKAATQFYAERLLEHLVQIVINLRMKNLESMLSCRYHAHVRGDSSKRFPFAAGNDTPGLTAAVRLRASPILGEQIDNFVGDLPGLVSVTVHVQDINRDRGYSTTADGKKERDGKPCL